MTAAIETRGLTKRYGSVLALDGLDLDIEAGEIFGLLGPNGAGKSTTLRLLLGFARPTAGSARIAGFDVLADLASAHRHVAFVAGDLALWPQLTGRETLDFLGALHGDFDADYREELIKRFSLEPDKRVREYSKGNRQKVGLIGAFMTRASVLIFDEPTSGLDPLMELAFRQCVLEAKASGQTALVSSHILSEVEAICDRVGILRAGRLVDVGTLDEMRGLSARVVEATFAGPPPDIAHVEGVSDVSVDGNVVRCHVRGPMTQLMRVLADAGAVDLSSREPSLEELFLAHYGDDSAATGGEGERGVDP